MTIIMTTQTYTSAAPDRSPIDHFEQALEAAVVLGEQQGCPPRLGKAIRYAIFPGGSRIRPRLCMAVAQACGDCSPQDVFAAAVAVELMHCASLIHDDLPCFDDAQTRRGKPSLHIAFSEQLAVLAGDALIVLSFQTLAKMTPQRLGPVLHTIASCVGVPFGIVAGQAWECEPTVPLALYQRAKTGGLFSAATVGGAAAAGIDPEPWRAVGDCLGEAYQVADDIRDATSSEAEMGKPAHQDENHGRPSAVRELGIAGARTRLKQLVKEAVAAIPTCPGEQALRQVMAQETKRFLEKALSPRPA